LKHKATRRQRKTPQQPKADPEIVWRGFIVRDGSSLVRAAMAGDTFALTVLGLIADWGKMWATIAPEKAPLCLACEHEFNRQAPSPIVFGVIHSDDPRIQDSLVTGICDHCAGKTDAELMTHLSKWMSTNAGARVIGYGHTPSSQGGH
jgi:hypothetical protein